MRGIALVACFVLAACSKEPQDYDDCVLKKVTAGMDKAVAAAVLRSCRNKFPEVAEPLTDLPLEAVAKLTGRFGITGAYGSGNLYNANEQWLVEEITVVVFQKIETWKRPANASGPEVAPKHERYVVKLSVSPLTSSSFSMAVNPWPEDEYQWLIQSARGQKIR